MMRILIPSFFFLAAVAIGVVLLVPQWASFRQVRAEMEDLEILSVEIDDLVVRRDTIVENISGISQENFQRLEQMVPQGAKGPEFLVYLEQLAVKHRLELERLDLTSALRGRPVGAVKKPLPTLPQTSGLLPKTINDIGVMMTIGGSYEAFKEFLADLESSVRITDVINITIAPVAGNQFNFTLRLTAYYR